RSSAGSGQADGGRTAERRPLCRACPVRLRVWAVSLPGPGTTLLAALRGALSPAPGGLPPHSAGARPALMEAIRARRRPEAASASGGLVLSSRAARGRLLPVLSSPPGFPFRDGAGTLRRAGVAGRSEIFPGELFQGGMGGGGDEWLGILQ